MPQRGLILDFATFSRCF